MKAFRWQDWESIIAIIFMVGAVFFALDLADQPNNDSGEIRTFTSAIADFTGFSGLNPFTAILKMTNYVTMIYGVIIYGGRTHIVGKTGLVITCGYFLILLFISWLVDKYGSGGILWIIEPLQNIIGNFIDGYNIEQRLIGLGPHKVHLYKEYSISMLLIAFFMGFDYASYHRSTDKAEAIIFAISTHYISLPTFITLSLTFLLHSSLLGHGISDSASIAFLAGVTAVMIFLSNFVLAAVTHPWIAKHIHFGLEEGNVLITNGGLRWKRE